MRWHNPLDELKQLLKQLAEQPVMQEHARFIKIQRYSKCKTLAAITAGSFSKASVSSCSVLWPTIVFKDLSKPFKADLDV